jgi:hypothetical protein
MPPQHGGGFGAVAEVDAVERDAALDGGQLGGAAGWHFGAGVQDVAQAGHGDAGLLEVGPQLGHAHDGLGHALGKHVEGDELAHAEFIAHDQVGAVPEGGGVDELANQVDAFVRPAGQVLGLEAGADVGGELVVPAARKAGLQGAGLDGLDAGDGFDQHGLVLCTAGELDVQALAQNGHHGQAQAKVQRQADQHDEGQRHAVEQHDGDEDHREQHVQHHGEGVAGEEAADVLQFAHAGHRVAHAARLEVGQGQLHAGGGTAARRVPRRCGWWCG